MPWTKIRPDADEPDYGLDAAGHGRRLGHAAALREALALALTLDERVFVMGQGVDDPGGMFGATRGLHQQFGGERVFDTPLAETALTGVAVGAALAGMRPVYLHNRPDFLFLALDQLANHAAKWRFMFGGAAPSVPLVVWACIGRGWGSAAQHSQALQGIFQHIPGLKLVMPSTCHDAKGLLLAAIRDDNPVVVIDHRFNFRNKGPVPEGPYYVPLGQGVVRRPGRDVTVAGFSHLVNDAFVAAEELAREEGIEAEVVDLRTIRPLDEALLLASLARTGRLVAVDTGWKTGGVAAELAAVAVEKGFAHLRAPVARVTCPDLPTPAGYSLEAVYYVGKEQIKDAIRRLAAS